MEGVERSSGDPYPCCLALESSPELVHGPSVWNSWLGWVGILAKFLDAPAVCVKSCSIACAAKEEVTVALK